MRQRRWRDLDALCRSGIRYHVEVPELHKMMITAREEHGSWEDAAACYQLEPVNEAVPGIEPHDILCCVVVRNERPRLPWFLSYYRRLGVDRLTESVLFSHKVLDERMPDPRAHCPAAVPGNCFGHYPA